jgi:hypothetical protein
MNIRSFADLDDIVIDSFHNSSYDEDLFEIDSSTREPLHTPDISSNLILKSPTGLDYADDLFESDDNACVNAPTGEADLHEGEISYAYSMDKSEDSDENTVPDTPKEHEVVDSFADAIHFLEMSVSSDVPTTNDRKHLDDAQCVPHVEIRTSQASASSVDEVRTSQASASSVDEVRTSQPSASSVDEVRSNQTSASPVDGVRSNQASALPVDVGEANKSLKVVFIPQNLFTGQSHENKNQFSSVKRISGNDEFILKQLIKQKKEGSSSHNITSDMKRENIIKSLEEMLLIAADRVEVRSAAASQVAGRAIHIPSTDCGMTRRNADRIMVGPTGSRVYGIPDYDPDYDCAFEMEGDNRMPLKPSSSFSSHLGAPRSIGTVRTGPFADRLEEVPRSSTHYEMLSRLLPDPNLKRDGGEGTLEAESSSEGKTDLASMKKSFGPDFNYLQAQPIGIGKRIASHAPKAERAPHLAAKTVLQPAAAVPSVHRGAADMVLDDIREGKVTADLLRLGVDRDMLSKRSEEMHCTFLSDLLGAYRRYRRIALQWQILDLCTLCPEFFGKLAV